MPSKDLIEYNKNGYKGFVRRGYDQAPFLEYLSAIDEHVKEVEARHYKNFDAPTDRMVTTVEAPFLGGPRTLMLKQDDFTRSFNASKSVKYAFKRSRGLKGWEAANMLLDGFVLVPEPLAYIEKRSMGAFKKGYLFMEYIEGAVLLRDAVKENTDREQLIVEAGSIMRKVHDLGCVHGDMKSTNFLVKGTGNEKRVYLIDFEDVSFSKKVAKKERINDIMRFIESIEDITKAEVNALLTSYGRDLTVWNDNITINDLRQRIKGARKDYKGF